MDLDERGLRPQADALFNRYIWMSDDSTLSGLAALPIFLSIRAAIRAKVIAANLDNLSGEERNRAAREAARYFWFAEDFLTGTLTRPSRQPLDMLRIRYGFLFDDGGHGAGGVLCAHDRDPLGFP
jgi:hypothetical protein